MKKVKVILVALTLMLGTLLTTAANPATTAKTPLSAEIAKLLEDPYFIQDVELLTTVTFLINSEGEIVVLDVDTENQQVERFIKSRLNYSKINTQLQKGKEYKVPVHFVPEE